jgi:hypothetical protein
VLFPPNARKNQGEIFVLKNLNPQQIWFAVILMGALLLFITELIRADILAVLVVQFGGFVKWARGSRQFALSS